MDRQTIALIFQEGGKFITELIRTRPFKRPEPARPVAVEEQPPEVVKTTTVTEEGKASSIEAGCVPCIPPTALVITNPSIKEAQNIVVGDKVLDGHGNYSTVIKVWERPYSGELISITIPYQKDPLLLTPEHPVLAIKAKHCSKLNQICFPGKDNPHCQNCLGKKYSPEFISAKDLVTSGASNHHVKHILLAPQIKSTKDIHEIKVSEVAGIGFENIGEGWIKPRKGNSHNRGRSAVAIRDRILVNNAFMALAGFYLSEGSAYLQSRGGQTRFDFSKEEENYASEVKGLLMDIFGVQATISPNSPSTIRVLVSSRLLAYFFMSLFGKGALNKHIPQWMLTLPLPKQKVLVEKYWCGDGSQWLNATETQTSLSATTVSRNLAYSLRLILHRLGIIHSLGRYKTNDSMIDGRLIKSNGYHYQIQINPPSAIRLAEMINFPVPKNWRFLQSHQAGIDDAWIYLPIKKIQRKPYRGIVMNLTTEPDNTYSVEGVAVHNCAIGHFGTCSGLLNEAMRFAKKDGVGSSEVIDRVNMCLDELNAMERVDLRPELITDLPDWEKELANRALTASRATRHGLEGLTTGNDLEKVAASTQTARTQIGRGWFKERLARMPKEEKEKLAEKAIEKLEGE